MPVPKRKLSRARIRSRQSNKFLKPQLPATCKNCQEPVLSHQVCQSCGFYKGRKILETKVDRALKRGQLRQAQQQKAAKAQESTEE